MSDVLNRLTAVLAGIDHANAQDPEIIEDETGRHPAALLYGHRMSLTLGEFAPGASELLQIAVRGQHIERWKRPRGDYPQGKPGYLKWRRDAAKFHADRIAGFMHAEGYSPEEAARVGLLIMKQAIKSDAEAQTLEDVACLVFMRWYFVGFAASRTPEELLTIVEKTARKMSAEGRREALKLPLPAQLVPAVMAAG